MKKISLITLLPLLSTGSGLHAGCWMPESDTVKNHYKGIDGGYVKVKGTGDPNDYYIRLRGKSGMILRPGKDFAHIFTLGATETWTPKYRIFIPRGYRGKARQAIHEGGIVSASYEDFHDKDIENLAKKYWPHLTGISLGSVDFSS